MYKAIYYQGRLIITNTIDKAVHQSSSWVLFYYHARFNWAGLNCLLNRKRTNQQNRAMEVLDGKFYRDGVGNKSGMGLKVFP